MDVQQKLDDIVAAVEGARSMPMSASCVVNRAELLGMLEEVRQALPGSLAQAQELIGDREQMIAEARREAQRIIDSAQAERGSLVSGTEIARRAQEEADRILTQARQEAEGIRAEADDYVDSKLANFEVVLSKTIGSVDRGREKLLGRDPGADLYGEEDGEDIPERSADPAELRERADAYVEAQFRAFEAVLSKTLEAVGRGRQKLTGHRPIDELGAHLAAQDEHGQQSDADYLADLAAVSHEPQQPQPPRQAPQVPAQPPQQQPAYEPQQPQQDPYAYQQQPQQGGYGYPQEGYPQEYGQPQQDPYAYQQQSPPQPAYQQQPQQGGYGYPQEGYPQEYGQPQQDPYAYQQQSPPQPAHPPQQPAALDETSFFDTSMIDMEQLRQYEQGR